MDRQLWAPAALADRARADAAIRAKVLVFIGSLLRLRVTLAPD
jgi:hypothetical protein